MKICTHCRQTVPERVPLADQVLALLATSSTPLPPRAIRKALGSAEGTTAVTLRRMVDRGLIRKATVDKGITGYVAIVEVQFVEEGIIPAPVGSEEEDEVGGILQELVAYVGSTPHRVQPWRNAVLLLSKRFDLTAEQAEQFVGLAVSQGRLERDGEFLREVEPE